VAPGGASALAAALPPNCTANVYVVTLRADNTSDLLSLDLGTGVGRVVLGSNPNAKINVIGVSPANGHVYGASPRSADLFYDFNPATNTSRLLTVQDRVFVPANWDSSGADVTLDGTEFVSASNGNNLVLVYDANPANLTFGDVIATMTLAGGATFKGNDFSFNPKDGFAYSATNGNLYRYDFSTNPGRVHDGGDQRLLVGQPVVLVVVRRDGQLLRPGEDDRRDLAARPLRVHHREPDQRRQRQAGLAGGSVRNRRGQPGRRRLRPGLRLRHRT
jgi:hypothetical protein